MEKGAAARPLLHLLNETESLRRLLRLYPKGHPGLQPAHQRLRTAAEAYPDGTTLALGLGPDRVFVGGEECLLGEGLPGRRLAASLFQLGLAGLRLEFPAAAGGLQHLAALLAGFPEPPGEHERRRLLDAGSAFAGVELVPLDLRQVQIVEEGRSSASGGAGRLMVELAKRLGAGGTYPLPGAVNTGQLSPGSVLQLLDGSSTPETLLDHLFAGLAEVLREGAENRRVLLREVRVFLGELLPLLDPERRHLAMTVATRHLPLWAEGEDDDGEGPLVAAALVLDTVELMIQRGYPVPAVARRAVDRMADAFADPDSTLPDEIIIRAKLLAGRLEESVPATPSEPSTPAPGANLPERGGVAWAQELCEALEDRAVHLDLGRVLLEAVTLWPREPVAEAAAVRLAEELVAALEVGDFDAARRLAPAVVASSSPEAGEIVNRQGTRAAVRALRIYDREHHPTVVGVLAALGEAALPEVLDALAIEENLTVRKRLLEVVLRQGSVAIPLVRPLLRDSRWFVVRNAVFLLRRLGDQESLPTLKRRLETAKPQVRAEILKALVGMADPQWAELLFREIDSGDPERSGTALAVAGRVRNQAIVQGLAARLRERIGLRLREPLALGLIRALGRLRDPAALAVLSEIVALKPWRMPVGLSLVRKEAACAIAALDGPSAQIAARRLADDRDGAVAGAVREALRRRRAPQDDEELA